MGNETVEWFEHPGLFMVLLDEPSATPATEEVAAVFAHPRHLDSRAERRRRQAEESALHRYCSGCSRDTEHVAWATRGPTNMPSIQWPAAESASGTTICLDCGQWRAAVFGAGPPVWSSWPRKPGELTPRRVGATMEAESAAPLDDGASEAAENAGMPPRPERPSTRLALRAHPAASPRRRAVPARRRQVKPAVSPSGGREQR